MSYLSEYKDYLVMWLKSEVKKAKSNGVIFGLSGGVDSALVAKIAKDAFPENHLALIMPFDKKTLDHKLASDFSKSAKIIHKEVDISETAKIFFKSADISENKLIRGNSLARIRMMTLYAYAQKNNYLVLGTDNACEWYIGYFTKFGDGAGDLFPIINLLKREVRELSKLLDIPKEIIYRSPTASLWDGQTDEIEMGFTYDDLDNFLSNNSNINPVIKEKIFSLHKNTDHKRKKGPIPLGIKEYKK